MICRQRQIIKLVISACVILAVFVLISLKPARSAVESVLSLFRADNTETVKLSLKDIDEMKSKLINLQGKLVMENLCSVEISGGKVKPVYSDPLKVKAGFKIILPKALNNFKPSVTVKEPVRIKMSIKVENMNKLLLSFGAKKLFPLSINNKKFEMLLPTKVSLRYSIGNKYYLMEISRFPEVKVAEGVNLDDLNNALNNFPLFPTEIQNRLKALVNWKTSLFLPDIASGFNVADINGAKGYVTNSTMTDGAEAENIIIIWHRNGVVYSVNSNTSGKDLIAVARSVL